MIRIIHVMVMGDAANYTQLTLPAIINYGVKCKADVYITTHTTEHLPQWERLRVLSRALTQPWNQLLMIDADVVISPDAPDIFTTFPTGFHICEDVFLPTTVSIGPFNRWMTSLGLPGRVPLNGGVMLMDRSSLEQLSHWIHSPKISGPFEASDQNHEILAIYSTWPNLKPMPLVWNTPEPHYSNPEDGAEVMLPPGYFRHTLESRGWQAKEVYLSRIQKSLTPKLSNLFHGVHTPMCLPRVLNWSRSRFVLIDRLWQDMGTGYVDFFHKVSDAKIVVVQHVKQYWSLYDFADFIIFWHLSEAALIPQCSFACRDHEENREFLKEIGIEFRSLPEFQPMLLVVRP